MTKEEVIEIFERFVIGAKPCSQREIVDACASAYMMLKEQPSLTQEQPSEDLEKEIEKQIRRIFYDLDGIAIMGTSKYASVKDMEFIARHFYGLGLNARKEE